MRLVYGKGAFVNGHTCFCCDTEVVPLIDFGTMPLVNTYSVKTKYPLQVNRCPKCYHLQLHEYVDPEILYSYYTYCSGTGRTALDYFRDFARTAVSYVPKAESVLDIASNDGSQLDAFKALGLKTYGVDPAENLSKIAAKKGHTIHTAFFESMSTDVDPQTSDIITAQNVVGHSIRPLDFLINCKNVMHDESRLFLATSQANMIVNGECDACLLPGELVATEHGFRPIEEIEIGDYVLTHLGNWEPVTHCFKREYSGSQLDVYVYGYNRPLRVTPEHPLVKDGVVIPYPKGRPKNGVRRGIIKTPTIFTPASKIKKRDHLLRASINSVDSVKYVAVSSKKGSSRNPTITEFPVNTELMRICGYYLAEGFYSTRQKRDCACVDFAFGHSSSEKELAEDCCNCLRIHGAASRLRYTKYGWRVGTSGAMARMLHEQFGTGAANKSLPAWSYDLGMDSTKDLLESYGAGDGYLYRKARYIRIGTVSEKLANGISLLANKLGWSCCLNFGKARYDIQIHNNPKRTEKTRPYIDILIRRNPIRSNKVSFTNKCQSGTVHKIEERQYSGLVYNLEVRGDNSYVTPQCSVHNCYHEHVSYFNAHSMLRLAERAGLEVIDIVMHDIHGTSYVFVLGKKGARLPWTSHNRIKARLEWEQSVGMMSPPLYHWWKSHVRDKIKRVGKTIEDYRREGYYAVGCGAAAKGISMLNMARVKVDVIVDTTPTKWNQETSEMTIVPFDQIREMEEDKILFVVLAWNVGQEIRSKVLALRDNKNDVFIETR